MRDDASNDQISASQLEPLEVGDRTIWAARPMAEWRERGYVPDSDEEEDVGWGTGLSVAISPTASVAPATSKGLESIVGIGELTKGVEIEHIGSTFAVGSGNDVLSRKVESTLAEKRFGKDKELLQSDSLGNAATEVTECEDAKPSKTQSGPSKTTGAHKITSVSVGDRLEGELEYGLKSVREILGNTCVHLRLNSANHSCSSSPLSSIRSFTDDDEVVESAGHNKLMHGQANRSTEAEPTDWHYQHDSHPRYLGRELRQRNPIQIHPYALEDARYQQELKARGLKPVKVAPVSSEIYRNPAADDTQHQDLFSNNQVDDSQSIGGVDSALRSQNISPPGMSRAARSTRPLELFEDDGELPELSAILGGDVPNWLPNKRRKVAHKSSRETSQPFGCREFRIPELPPADLGRARHEEMGIDIFEIPHSPPHSGSSNVSSALMTPNDMSGPAQRLTPLGLPTPVASSLTKALSEPIIETDNSEISEGSQTDGSSVRGSSPPAAERRQWRAIQSVQRRIKGVLPASWLTLDLDKQTIKKKSRRPSVGSPIQKSVAKGVAQKLKTNKPRRSLMEDGDVPVIDISDDSASDTSHSSSAKAWARQPPQLFEDGDIDGFGEPSLNDVIEDNHIDMLPPLLPRTRRKDRLPVKGQRTLDESLTTTGIFSLDRPRSLKARHEGTKQPRARRKHSHSKPVPVALQLEILDAPSFAQLSADDQPQFLKIAARRARTRRDKSRPGHSSKYVRSSLEANTRDVHSRLLVPGESRVRPQAKDLSSLPEHSLTQGPLPDHQPYQRTSDVPDLSTRPIRAAIPNPEQIASLKTSTAATIHRILLRQVGNSAFTSLDDYSTERKASNAHPVLPQRSLPSRLLSHYQNRSGKGRMISSFAQGRVLRPAQLEAFQSSPQHISNKSLPSQGPPQSRKRVPQQQKIIKTHELPSGHAAVSSPTMARTLRPLGQPLPQHLPGPPVAEDGQIVTALKRGQMPFLMEGTFYHESTLIGSGDLAETILKILKTPRSLHLNNGDSRSFSLPNTKVLYIWDAWNPTVASQFISVCQTLFQECTFAITTQDNTLHAILARLTQYLRRIIDYINHVLYFEDAAARTSFITTCVEILPSIVMVASSTERVPDEVQGPILHILNHVVVLAFQVSHIASVAPVEHGLQLQAWDLFDTIARRILSLTLSERGQSKLLEYLRVNKIRSERERGIRMDYPEVDAMVIVSHLSNRKILGESCSTMIYKILATKLEGHGDNHTYDSVLEVMAFIWTIAPFFSIKDTGCLSRKRFTKDDFARWPAVLSVFEAFLKSRTYSKDPNAPDNIIGRRYIHLCVHLATGWGWIDCAGLVQLLRTQYGSNNMDELFAEKSSNTRDFLDNYPGYGRIPSPFDNDSGFDSFLKLIITSGMQKASRSEKISNLSNFIFSIVPNSGQLVRKNQNHDHRVLRPLQNRHDLYSALYFISPLETKIRLLPQIQSLVDLRESHIRACTISLDTLIRLLRFQISTDEDPRILYHLSKSIQDMIKKMEGQFDAARLEAFAQVEGTVPGENVLNTVRFNQRNIQKFLKSTIQAWSDCIRDSRTPDQAGYLLFGEDCGTVLSLCNRAMALNPESMTTDIDAFRDDVIEAILSTITSYIINWLPKSDNVKELLDLLRHPLKGVLSTQLGRFEQCSDEVLKSLTDCWHAFAKVSVDAGVRSWDNYLSLGGRDAWQSFDDTWHKRQYEVYFAARFVEYNKEAWREWQIPILQLWIASMLQPEMRFQYQADLTTQIMRYDASFNPLLFHLPLVIYEDEVLVEVNFDELVMARTPLIVALLRNMNKITTRPDSQDTFFGPSQGDCSAILKNMIAVVKQYLQEFEGEPDTFEVYAAFASRTLSEMRIYTNHLEPVPELFEYRPGKSLPLALDTIKAKLKTYKQLLIDNAMEKHMIVFMHTTAERAAITGQQKALEDQLVSVFLDLNPESVEDVEGYAADAYFRTLFFQNVFPAYLDRVFHRSGFIIAQPILQCILMVYKSLRFQLGFWRKDLLDPFTTATLTLLTTLKTTLAGPRAPREHILSDPSQLRAYTYLSLLMFEILCRCQEMEDSFGPFGALADIWEYFLFFYKFTFTVAFRPPLALPGRLPDDDDDDQIPLLEPELSRADAGMLAYSRQELGERLDFKWVAGADDKWYVSRAGGRKELVQGDGGVGTIEEEARNMHNAAEKYVRAFSALWDAY